MGRDGLRVWSLRNKTHWVVQCRRPPSHLSKWKVPILHILIAFNQYKQNAKVFLEHYNIENILNARISQQTNATQL